MSDKYTLEQVGDILGDVQYRTFNPHELAAIIRQLLDDHETMRRALEFYADVPNYNARAKKALGEVTK